MKSYSEWLAYVAVFTVLSAIAGFATLAMYAMCLPRAWVNSLNSGRGGGGAVPHVGRQGDKKLQYLCVCVISSCIGRWRGREHTALCAQRFGRRGGPCFIPGAADGALVRVQA